MAVKQTVVDDKPPTTAEQRAVDLGYQLLIVKQIENMVASDMVIAGDYNIPRFERRVAHVIALYTAQVQAEATQSTAY